MLNMPKPIEDIPYLTQWQLVRSAIEHENTLKSHRVTWFLATQVILVTGFSSIFVEAVKTSYLFASIKVYGALFLIFLIGIYACILAWANIRAAQKMIVRLQTWWLTHCCDRSTQTIEEWVNLIKYGTGQNYLPPVNGIFTSNLHLVFNETQLPLALGIFWIILLIMTTALLLNKRCGVHPLLSSIFLAWLGIFVFFILGNRTWSWLNKASNKTIGELHSIRRHYSKEIDTGLSKEIRNIIDKKQTHMALPNNKYILLALIVTGVPGMIRLVSVYEWGSFFNGLSNVCNSFNG